MTINRQRETFEQGAARRAREEQASYLEAALFLYIGGATIAGGAIMAIIAAMKG